MEPSSIPPTEKGRRRPSPAWIATAAIALLVIALVGSALMARLATSLPIGSPVPDLTLTAFDGREMNLKAQQGKVVVINFFASWCTPCRQEAADLELAWRAYRDRGQEVQFFGIAYKDASSKAVAFLQEFDVSYPCGSDPGGRTARAYGVTGVPETFIIDRHGLLARHILGPVAQAELRREIDRLLSP